MLNNNFPFLSKNVELSVSYLTLMMKGINSALRGKMNCTGSVTLTASVATTTVTDNRCLANSVVLYQSTTAHAAAELATLYTVAAAGSFVIHHANNGQTDRIFNYAILG